MKVPDARCGARPVSWAPHCKGTVGGCCKCGCRRLLSRVNLCVLILSACDPSASAIRNLVLHAGQALPALVQCLLWCRASLAVVSVVGG